MVAVDTTEAAAEILLLLQCLLTYRVMSKSGMTNCLHENYPRWMEENKKWFLHYSGKKSHNG
ncbi:hypothetical protein L798_00753 [Zootermopsis nevadensis]|uniref:Uncharacterized protein n=1 Tax=Zootermopsis nevadensis TaxID=136037 RepID=A0A067QWP5_ZOONE|nr:hypothetical protein L798_00753 [Zootermopsis nevadensis]